MLFKSGVWESLSDFQFCGGGGNGRGKLTKCPNYFVRGCSWVVGDCYHTAQFFIFHTFFFTLYLGSFNDRSYDRVKGLRTRLKLRCFPEQFIPYYSIYVGTSHSGCALYRGFLNYDWTNRFLRHAAEVPNVPCSLWVFVFVPRWRGTCPPTFSCV